MMIQKRDISTLDRQTSTGDLVRVNVGIANEYSGSTEHSG